MCACVCVNDNGESFLFYLRVFFFVSRAFVFHLWHLERDFNYPKTTRAFFLYETIALFYFLIFRTRLYDTTHLLNIMFAATQQIASVAGLKATKVQVRRFASHRSGDDFERFCPPPFFLNRIR